MTSGVTLGTTVQEEYMQMKQKKTFKYMMFRLSNDKSQIIIDDEMCLKSADLKDEHKECDKDCWNEMVTKLEEKEPRYIVYDIHSVTKGNRQVEKLLFISWCPDNCPVGKKMVHAASEDTIWKSLEGLHGTKIQAHEKDDLEYDDALKVVITRD